LLEIILFFSKADLICTPQQYEEDFIALAGAEKSLPVRKFIGDF